MRRLDFVDNAYRSCSSSLLLLEAVLPWRKGHTAELRLGSPLAIASKAPASCEHEPISLVSSSQVSHPCPFFCLDVGGFGLQFGSIGFQPGWIHQVKQGNRLPIPSTHVPSKITPSPSLETSRPTSSLVDLCCFSKLSPLPSPWMRLSSSYSRKTD